MSSDPSLSPVVPPMAAAAASSPLRGSRDPDDDGDDALEDGELRVPIPDLVPSGHESSDDDGDDGQHYLFQPRVAVDYYYDPEPPRRRLDTLDILFAGSSSALPSPTPSGEGCDSDGTISDDDSDHHRGFGGNNPTGSNSNSNSSAVVGWGWAATGKRGWKPATAVAAPPPAPGHFETLSATGDGHAGNTTTSSISAPAVAQHHQPPLPAKTAPKRRQERATEFTCDECGKTYTTHQALGGHTAGHRGKQREAANMAAAAAAGGGGDPVALAAALLHLRRGGGGNGGKAADRPHECRKCGKVFAKGVALGGHMRVHFDGPRIVPVRKNKKRCLAPMPPQPEPEPPTTAAVKAEEETPPAVRVVRLFGIDIRSEAPEPAPATLEQQQQGSGGTTEDDSSSTEKVRGHLGFGAEAS